jgi:hypothetical protein
MEKTFTTLTQLKLELKPPNEATSINFSKHFCNGWLEFLECLAVRVF